MVTALKKLGIYKCKHGMDVGPTHELVATNKQAGPCPNYNETESNPV